jgi:hypothetical protein
VEPIRKVAGPGIEFLEAECVAIDTDAKTIKCKCPNSDEDITPVSIARNVVTFATRVLSQSGVLVAASHRGFTHEKGLVRSKSGGEAGL